MKKQKSQPSTNGKKLVPCAIYTRVSSDEGLDMDFTSIDAQREAYEAYIKSLAHEGWVLVPDRYEDAGISAKTLERPALKRLLNDIASGKVEIVVFYKIDRFSRSLLDFAKLMDIFEKHHASFVSITQQVNTATPMGRLILNVLMSFAQFERELISERTRDKIAATRRKGKWSGGRPILGYDVDPNRFKLLVNEAESSQVKIIFDLYLLHQSLQRVCQ